MLGLPMKQKLHIPTTSRDFQEASRSDLQFPATISPRSRELSRRKRVRFKDLDYGIQCGPQDDSVPAEAVHPPRCDGAKTSEYAFFKKLKKDAGDKFGSHPLNDGTKRIKAQKLKSVRCLGERSKIVDDRCGEEIKNPFPVEKAAPVNFYSFHSLPGNASKDSERSKIVDDRCNEEIKYPFLVEKATPLSIYSFHSPLGNASKSSDVKMKKGRSTLDHLHKLPEDMEEYYNELRPEGTQYKQAGTFSRKRQKLCQWVADTSFPDKDGFCSKGYDIISALLDRLISKSNVNNNREEPKVGQVETCAESLSLASHESDIDCKNIQPIFFRNLRELECGLPLFDPISSSLSNRSSWKIPYLDSDSPTRCANITRHHCRVWESDSALSGGISTLCDESNFIFPSCKYGSGGYPKGLDLFYEPNRYLDGRKLDMPMLDWVSDSTNNERSLSIPYQNMEVKMHHTSSASRVDSQYYANRLFSPSNLPGNRESNNTLPLSCLSSYRYRNHEFGRHLLESKEDIISDPIHPPLTLSCTPSYFNAEDCHNDDGSEGGSKVFTPHHNYWFMTKAIKDDYHSPDTEAFLSSELVFDFGLKCFPVSRFPEEQFLSTYQALQLPGMHGVSPHFHTSDDCDSYLDGSKNRGLIPQVSEDSGSMNYYPSLDFQLYQNREQAWPLLVDKSCQDGIEEYMDFENRSLKYIL